MKIINKSPNPTKRPKQLIINNKKEKLPISGHCCPGGLNRKNQRKQKGQLLGPWQKTKRRLWNLKSMVILSIKCMLGTIPKSLIRELEEMKNRWAENVLTATLLRSPRIWKKESWDFEGTSSHSNSSERASADNGANELVRDIEEGWLQPPETIWTKQGSTERKYSEKKGKKSNCTDVLSDYQSTSHTRIRGFG